jgi:hypothetical protein
MIVYGLIYSAFLGMDVSLKKITLHLHFWLKYPWHTHKFYFYVEILLF